MHPQALKRGLAIVAQRYVLERILKIQHRQQGWTHDERKRLDIAVELMRLGVLVEWQCWSYQQLRDEVNRENLANKAGIPAIDK